MIINKKLLIIFLYLHGMCSIIASTHIPINILTDKDCQKFKVLEYNIEHSGKNAAISIISDGTNKYILKQIKNDTFQEQFSLIKEVIISAIGCDLNINVDRNFFIPYNAGENIKIYKDKAATLHSFIEGISLSLFSPECIIKNFRISQRYRPYLYEYKHGFEILYGFNEVTIQSMSCHKDFPGIIALDTFFGNYDRDTDNIIFDEKNNMFYGIDQGAALTGELPFLPIFAFHQITKLDPQNYFETCTSQIRQSIGIYKNYLKILCGNYQPDEIIYLIKQLIPLLKESPQSRKKENEYIHFLSFYIKQSHTECLKVVNLLEYILTKKVYNETTD